MATIGNTLPTLADWAKRTDPNGNIVQMAELLQQRIPILQDIVFQEGNLTTGHRVSSRTGLPSVSWRMINQGIAPSKSQVDNYDETCGMLEGMSVVDTALVELNGNGPAFRASEDQAFVQAMGHEVSTGLFYHSTKTAPEKFTGLTPRFSDLTTAACSTNFVDWDDYGTLSGGDYTSIWFVTWGPKQVYGIFPKGMSAGLASEDLGKQLWTDSGGTNKFTAWITKWQWKVGLVVEDWRNVVRFGNIDVSAVGAETTTATLIQGMIDSYYKLNDPSAGRTVIYCNRKIAAGLHKHALNKASYTLTVDNAAGHPIVSFMGIPIRVTDSIISTETQVA
jgi:hypothetical protein